MGTHFAVDLSRLLPVLPVANAERSMPHTDFQPPTAPPASSRPGEYHADPPPARQEVSARLVVLLGALTAFSPLAIDMYLPAFPQIERDLAAPPGSLQLTLSLFLAGLALGQFVVG